MQALARIRPWTVALLVVAMLTAVSVVPGNAATAQSGGPTESRGTDFWLTFPGNFDGATPYLFIGAEAATTGTVSVPGLSWSEDFAVAPGEIATVYVPAGAEMQSSDLVEDKGIRVTAASPITVYGLNQLAFTTDAFLGYPVPALGTDYVVLSYVHNVMPSQLTVVGTTDGTTVTVTPTFTAGTRTAGMPYTVTLDEGQTYQVRTASNDQDATGTRITADQPIAVFGGVQCGNVPTGYGACDYIVEQLPPTETWGTSFAAMPLKERANSTFRILAAEDGTEVRIDGSVVATLAAGAFHEQVVTDPMTITSSEPVLVGQYANGVMYDNTTGDPFMMLIPGTEQFLSAYTISTPSSGFETHHVNVVVPTAGVGTIEHNGTALPSGDYVDIGGGMWGLTVDITAGTHRFEAPGPFGVFVYGWTEADSYGYPGGTGFSPVATVTDVTFDDAGTPREPATGEEYCTPVSVTDADGRGVGGVRVDFEVAGVNAHSAFAYTDEHGDASHCYVGEHAGEDTVRATVGQHNGETVIVWEDGPVDDDPIKDDPIEDDPIEDDPDEDDPVVSLPGRPTDLEAVPGVGSATVSWTTPANAAGLIGYRVRIQPGDRVITLTDATTSTVVDGLYNGATYTISVAALNAAGASEWSEPTTVRPLTVYGLPRGVERIAGQNRDTTAATLSSTLFEPGVPVVYIVNRDVFADGLAGGSAGAATKGPILLTGRDGISADTLAELQRLQPGRIVVLGGTAVVSEAVEARLAAYADEVIRVGGADRYETSALLSAATFEPGVPVAYLATGHDFADSLSGGPAAGRDHAPILLTEPDRIPAAVLAELERLQPERIVVLGGTQAIADEALSLLTEEERGTAKRVAGKDRYGTSAAVTASTFDGPVEVVYVATGTDFPDALAATPAVHAHGAALLLVHPDHVPAGVAAELERLRPSRIILLGGPSAVSDEVLAALGEYVQDA